MDRKQRSSNFELMRIFAMLLIVTYHYALFSGFRFVGTDIAANRLFYQNMLLTGKTGVNLFVMVSGYFQIRSRLRTSKVLQLWGQSFFYIMVIYFLFRDAAGTGRTGMGGMGAMAQDTLMGKIFFLSSGVQWFIATYMVMYLLSPYLNVLLNSMDRKTYRSMLILMSVLWVLIPTLSEIPGLVVTEFQGSDLMFFLYLYSLGAYLRLYHEEGGRSASFWFGLSAAVWALCVAVIVAVDIWNTKSMGRLRLLDYLFNYQNHALIMMWSVCLFLGFKQLKVKNSRVINYISSLTFGIYLIHDNWQIRTAFWQNVIKGASRAASPWFIPASILAVLAVFLGCGLIEAVRKLTVERLWMALVERTAPHIDRALERLTGSEEER